KTYAGCHHKGKTICVASCNSCKRDGLEYTCTDVKNRIIYHRWIDGKCYRCLGVDPPRWEQETTPQEVDEEATWIAEVETSRSSAKPAPGKAKVFRQALDLGQGPPGSRGKSGPNDAFSRARRRYPDVDPRTAEEMSGWDDEFCEAIAGLKGPESSSAKPHPRNGKPYRRGPKFVGGRNGGISPENMAVLGLAAVVIPMLF
ncbi:MAG: hypothetical protein L6R36_009319, partial [Xanthoria steineri]